MRFAILFSLFILACGPEPVEPPPPPPVEQPSRVDPLLAIKHLGFNATEQEITKALGEPCYLYHAGQHEGEGVKELLYCLDPVNPEISNGEYTVSPDVRNACAFRCLDGGSHRVRIGFQFINGASITTGFTMGPVIGTYDW